MTQIFGKILSRFFISKQLPCYIISKEPLIIVSYWLDFYKNSKKIISQLSSDKKSYLIFQLGYHVERPWRLDEVYKQFSEVQNQIGNKNLELIFLANSQQESNLLSTKGLKNIFCNQNAFLDETRYKVVDQVKKYDSIYLARITPIKRQELASQIKSLRLIGDYFESEKEYFEDKMTNMTNAKWKRKVWSFNVFKHMSQAHTGLCLSPEEGAMFVSTEYLLCGLPIVSTKSLGGRDIFFSDDYVKICNDCPLEIKNAVEEFKKKSINPHYIRFRTIRKMKEQRDKFIDLIQDIFEREDIKRDFRSEWPEVFTHKLGLRTSLPYSIAKDRCLTELYLNQEELRVAS